MARLRSVLVVLSLIALARVGPAYDMESAGGIWLFDEGQGGVASDSSGKGNHGTLVGDADWVNEGKFAGALLLDGQGDFVDCGNDDSLEIHESSVTFVMWIYANEKKDARIIWKNNGTPCPYRGVYGATWQSEQLGMFPDGSINFGFGDGDTCGRPFSAFPGVEEWIHVAVVRDREAKKIFQYVNGEVTESKDGTENVAFESNLFIGARPATAAHFNGMIDDVGFFKSALTEKDVDRIMTHGLEAGAAVSPSGKLANTWGRIKAGA